MKVYVIIKDDDDNLHQGHITESDSLIISSLVKCYPDNSMTKDFINDVIIRLAKKVNFEKVEL